MVTKSSFKRARNELVELGYIEVESQGRGKSPVYRMHSLVEVLDGETVEVQKHERAEARGAFGDEMVENRLTADSQGGVGGLHGRRSIRN